MSDIDQKIRDHYESKSISQERIESILEGRADPDKVKVFRKIERCFSYKAECFKC